jgi:photosystem II stability/assembly factor-like uncharacterized protein
MRKILLALLSVIIIVGLASAAGERADSKSALNGVATQGIYPAGIDGISMNPAYWDTLSLDASGMILNSVKAFDDGTIWLGGYVKSTSEDILCKSTDFGATWSFDTLGFTNKVGMVFGAKDANVALVGTWDGFIYRTTNGGTNWDSVYHFGDGSLYINGIMFAGGDSVIAIGDADDSGLLVVKSFDAGATWTRFANLPAIDATPNTYASYATYRQPMDMIGKNIWITTYAGSGTAPRILRTTDWGETWTSTAATLTGGLTNAYYIKSINMLDENVGWIVPRRTSSTQFCFAHKTTDGGITWSDTILVERGITLKAVKPVKGTNNLLALGYQGNYPKAGWSVDAGATWAQIAPDTTAVGADVTNAQFMTPNLAYVVGYYRALKFKVSSVTFQTQMNIKMREGGFQPGSGDVLQVKGSFNGWGGSDFLTDGDGDSLYTATLYIPEGGIEYKFFKTLRSGLDWESVANRAYTVVAGTQTIPSVYFDNDSVYTPPVPQGVTFQVNMKIKMLEQTFLPGSGDIVRVAGSFNNWGSSTDTLKDADNDSIYTKTITLNEGQAIEYKFLKTTRSGDWESMADNRKYTVPIGGGAIPVAFFDNDSIFNAPVTVNFLWQVSMTPYQTLGWFRPDLQDSIEVRGGFNGWGGTKLLPVPGAPGSYEAAIIYNGTIGDALSFKYFMDLDSAGATARFPGYVHSGTAPAATRDGFCYDHPAERGDGNRLFDVTGGGNTVVPQVYFSNIDPRGLMLNTTDSTVVTLKVNMGPAKSYVDAFVPGADTVRLIWQDILWRSAQRIARGGASAQFPDITMTLAPSGGDSIYQAVFTVKGKTHYNMQYTYRYIHPGGNAVDQSGGLGGQNLFISRYIQPVGPNSWPATYAAPTDQWKKDAPHYAENPPFPLDVEEEPTMGVPEVFTLMQNYPNPFNPSTRIRYAIPAQANVTLRVYNMLGQEVATLVNNEVQQRGNYVAVFDAQKLATGVYFYRLEAGKFVETRKMLLIK